MRWHRRFLGFAAAALIAALPAASHAALFVGKTKEHVICPTTGHEHGRYSITLEMYPGLGWGVLTYAGNAPLDVVVQWIADGRRGTAFTASGVFEDGSPIVMYGFTKGRRLKGWIAMQDYSGDGCMYMGNLRARGQ